MSEAWAINADAGSPEYSAQELRRIAAMHLFPGGGDRFGARQGVRPNGFDPVSVAGTTWTVHDLSAVVYPGLTSDSGPYVVEWQEESRSLDPADGSNDRLDGLDLQVRDDDEDASGFRDVQVVYTAGAPAGTPSAPAVAANSVRLATILVSAGGTPSPSVATLAQYTAAAGGVLPVRDASERPTVGLYTGMTLYNADSDALEVRSGSAWPPVASPQSPETVVFTADGSFQKANFPWAHRYKVRMKGGGASGGGAGATDGSQQAEGGGGGEGEYVEFEGFVADLPSVVDISIGHGGAGATNGENDGNSGGTTIWDGDSTITAVGGEAGDGGGPSSGAIFAGGGNGGSGGSGSATLRVTGSDGGTGRVAGGSAIKGAFGGGSNLSSPATSRLLDSSGDAGHLYGGGSAGASNSTGQSDRGSQPAAPGVVIVELY